MLIFLTWISHLFLPLRHNTLFMHIHNSLLNIIYLKIFLIRTMFCDIIIKLIFQYLWLFSKFWQNRSSNSFQQTVYNYKTYSWNTTLVFKNQVTTTKKIKLKSSVFKVLRIIFSCLYRFQTHNNKLWIIMAVFFHLSFRRCDYWKVLKKSVTE